MRQRHFWQALCALGALLLLAAPHAKQAHAIFVPLIIYTAPGSQSGPYDLSVLPTPGPSGSIVAPDGTVFNTANMTLRGLSQAALASRFAGQWTINDAYETPGGVVQQHQFPITAAMLTEDFAPLPELISPPEGSSVPRVFSVRWEDSDPTGSGFSIGWDGINRSDHTFTQIEDDHYRFTVNFAPGEVMKEVTFTAHDGETINLPKATPQIANPKNSWTPQLAKFTRSLPRHFQVLNVPEPTTGALIVALGAFASGTLRKRVGPPVVRG
jgi:hypothetical protein